MDYEIKKKMADDYAVPVYDNGIRHHDYRQGIGKDARKKKRAKRRAQKQGRKNSRK